MASRQKVDEYFVTAELDEAYTQTTEGMCNMMASKFAAVDKLDEAVIAAGVGKVHALIKDRVLDKVKDIYCEVFTDDELAEIMGFVTSPIGKKMRATLPYIQERMMTLFTGGIDLDAMFDEVFGEIL